MNGKRRMIKRDTYALIIRAVPEPKSIKLMKYQTLGSTDANAALKAVGDMNPAIFGTTKVITNVNNIAITENNMNLSCAPFSNQLNTNINARAITYAPNTINNAASA